jgi:Tfp pilus assembly protein PilN
VIPVLAAFKARRAVLKIGVPVLMAVVAFGGGWKVSDWRHGARDAKELRAEQALLAERLAEIREEYESEREAAQRRADALARQLQDVSATSRDLRDRARMVDADCNPFGPDFVRVWNDSASRVSGTDSATTP